MVTEIKTRVICPKSDLCLNPDCMHYEEHLETTVCGESLCHIAHGLVACKVREQNVCPA